MKTGLWSNPHTNIHAHTHNLHAHTQKNLSLVNPPQSRSEVNKGHEFLLLLKSYLNFAWAISFYKCYALICTRFMGCFSIFKMASRKCVCISCLHNLYSSEDSSDYVPAPLAVDLLDACPAIREIYLLTLLTSLFGHLFIVFKDMIYNQVSTPCSKNKAGLVFLSFWTMV